jgi:hypothetical protein
MQTRAQSDLRLCYVHGFELKREKNKGRKQIAKHICHVLAQLFISLKRFVIIAPCSIPRTPCHRDTRQPPKGRSRSSCVACVILHAFRVAVVSFDKETAHLTNRGGTSTAAIQSWSIVSFIYPGKSPFYDRPNPKRCNASFGPL